jgi:hypothetical protein
MKLPRRRRRNKLPDNDLTGIEMPLHPTHPETDGCKGVSFIKTTPEICRIIESGHNNNLFYRI